MRIGECRAAIPCAFTTPLIHNFPSIVNSYIPPPHFTIPSSPSPIFKLGRERDWYVASIRETCTALTISLPTAISAFVGVMTKLPQELIDEIIGQLPPGDRRSLQNCSLVAKSWTHSSQKYLFENVYIGRWSLQPWLDNISPTNATLLGHVRRLTYDYSETEVVLAHRHLCDYFPSFRQLRTFTFFGAYISSLPLLTQSFSAFKHSLSTISMFGCTVTTSGFATIINYFPNLTSLRLLSLSHRRKNDQTPPLSRPHLKRLFVNAWSADHLDLINELSGLGLRFDEVVIDTVIFYRPGWLNFVKRVIDVFGTDAKRLKVHCFPERMYSLPFPRLVDLWSPYSSTVDWSFLELSHCRELCEFETSRVYPNGAELAIISSIASTKIEKITLGRSSAFELFAGHAHWAQLDEILVNLAERSECKLGLEVEFRDPFVTQDEKLESGLTKYLPRFVEKGRMVVSDSDGGLIYCSDKIKRDRQL